MNGQISGTVRNLADHLLRRDPHVLISAVLVAHERLHIVEVVLVEPDLADHRFDRSTRDKATLDTF